MTGIWTPLTTLVGRVNDVSELVALIESHRLVTVTGPGGVGKTRLAVEVAQQVADQFDDGVSFIGLGAVSDPARVPAEVMSALGVRQSPDQPPLEVLRQVLAPRRMLLVLDNCEHLLPAVAELCDVLLTGADDLYFLATSRERLGLGGEAQHRLRPLELPSSEDPSAVGRSEAATLFAERARQVDPRFTLGPEYAALVADVVTRLDGMPLAIELAAARVEALGMAGLADRIDDALPLLTGKDPLAAARHRSLSSVAEWSYQLLPPAEQRVFRRLAVFPGPFTLEAAEAIAGPDAAPGVLRLVDCSLLVPPRVGVDRRSRYSMLQTLRAYGLARLRSADEQDEATAAMAAFAQSVAARAGVADKGGQPEIEAMLWLDAEDTTVCGALIWALEHDRDHALPLAVALVPWLRARGRIRDARDQLSAAVAVSSRTDDTWATAQTWLGNLASDFAKLSDGMAHHTQAVDAHLSSGQSRSLVYALGSRSIARLNLEDLPGALEDARRALAVAGDLGDPASEVQSLASLVVAAYYSGETAQVPAWIRQAQDLLGLEIPGLVARWSHYVLALVLMEMGSLDSARSLCADGLARARQSLDMNNANALLGVMAEIDRLAGDLASAAQHLREAIGLSSRTGASLMLLTFLDQCGTLCAAAGQPGDAVTIWAASAAELRRQGRPAGPEGSARRAEYAERMEQALGPTRLHDAEDRGAGLPIAVATEFALLAMTAVEERASAGLPDEVESRASEAALAKLLSPRERELVTLLAQGQTNAEIAGSLQISVRTVASHLDRIRDKTGCRRRADLTRLALAEQLI